MAISYQISKHAVAFPSKLVAQNGGEAEIRTLGGVAPSTVFKTANIMF